MIGNHIYPFSDRMMIALIDEGAKALRAGKVTASPRRRIGAISLAPYHLRHTAYDISHEPIARTSTG